jgi:hypothetical protein
MHLALNHEVTQRSNGKTERARQRVAASLLMSCRRVMGQQIGAVGWRLCVANRKLRGNPAVW